MTPPTFGIEEEFLICDAADGELRDDAADILVRAGTMIEEGLDHELRTAMVETGTAVCRDADTALRDLRAHRAAAMTAAAEVDARVLATGTHPTAHAREVGYTDDGRYRKLAARFGPIADQALVCGCHVHVAVPDRQAGVAVIDRIRPWLAPLVALTANSPLWQGRDTDYDSWRTQVWSRWPTAGPTSVFGDLDHYDRQADALVATGATIDRAALYYEARLSERWPTVEVRVADVCMDPDDAVFLGVLVRALVTTAGNDANAAPPTVTVEMLRAATFMASRFGMRGRLVDPTQWRAEPAATVMNRLVDHIRDALEDAGDLERATAGLDRLIARGTAAARQREAWRRGGTAAVLDLVALRQSSVT